MNIEESIRSKILQAFAPAHFELINESAKHKGHAGDDGSGQTHFKLIVVSDKFSGLTRVERQRLVNQELKEEFFKGLHTVSFILKTSSEM